MEEFASDKETLKSYISTEVQNATRGERATAKGFLKLWEARILDSTNGGFASIV